MKKKILSQASLISLILAILILFFILWIWRFFPFQKEIQGTSDAVLKAEIMPLNSSVSGYIDQIFVTDSQKVTEGQTLFTIDNRLRISEQKNIEARLSLLQKKIENLKNKKDQISLEKLQKFKLKEKVLLSEKKISQLKQEASIIKAPSSGFIERIRIHKGQYINRDFQLATLTGDKLWVLARYKETQLRDLDIGKKVKIKVDAFPKITFSGTIKAISSAVDNEYSLMSSFPSASATNARLKRISVQIVFDLLDTQKLSAFSKLRAGLSASVML